MTAPRMLGLRLYLCASAMLSALVLLSGDPSAITSVIGVTAREHFGALLLTVCTLIVLETVFNDVLGHRWTLQWPQRWRHTEFLVLAGINLGLILAVTSRNLYGLELTRFTLDACAAVYVALRDVQLRYIEPRKESNATRVFKESRR